MALLVFFSVSAALLLLQKPRTVEIVREVLKVQEVEKLAEKIVTEVKIDDLLLPDLALEKPSQLFISGSGTRRKIRFNTTFSNKGDGPFEVIGHSDEQRKTTFATQYIKRKDGTGMYREIGNFVFHPEHRHWHVANHVQYELWSLNADGSPAQIATNSGKMSICMFDDRPYDLKLPGAPQKKEYTFICNTRVQGVSVGWSDVYMARIEGQEVPLGNLADGTYIFRYSINPDRKILEKDYSNNEGSMKVEIKGSQLKVL
jgi:hypothetical protein